MSTVNEQINTAIAGVKAKKSAPEAKPEVSNAPALKEEAALLAEAQSANWGVVEQLETTDLLVPKIFHQQGLSELVKQRKAQLGDFCDSLTGEVLPLTERGTLEIIVFGSYKTLVVSKGVESLKGELKFEYLETVMVTPQNAKQVAELPQIEERDGQKYKNMQYYNLYCLLPSKIKELPFVLSLGSTKTAAAKKINTMIYKLAQNNRNGASVVFELKSIEEKNDKGSWFGIEVSQGRNTTAEELLRARAWYVKSQSQKFVVVEEEQAEAAAGNSESDSPSWEDPNA